MEQELIAEHVENNVQRKKMTKQEKEVKEPKKEISLYDLPGVGAATAEKLIASGYTDLMSIATAPPSELACSASKAATTGFVFGSKLNVTCAIQSVAIEPPR